jgi:DNA (cytosine-5)-methyltransferase 1
MVHGKDYEITDIGLRMLEPHELFAAQGFPEEYIIDKDYTGKSYPKTKQVARCGNAVVPILPKALVQVNVPELCGDRLEEAI